MHRARIIAIVTSIFAIISAAGVALLPVPLSTKVALSLALVVTAMHTGGAIIYLTSLSKFTRRLKAAYGFVCATSMLAAIGTIQLLVTSALELRSSAWVSYGGTELPFMLSVFFVCIGYSMFAGLLDIPYARWVPWLVAIVAGACAAGATLLPHAPQIAPEAAVDLSMAFSAIQVVCLIGAVALLFIIKRRASPLYTPPLAWMLLSLAAAALAGTDQFAQYLFLREDHWYVTYRFYTIYLGLSGIFSLKAALAFSAVPSAANLSIYQGKLTFFGKPKAGSQTERLSLVDVVIFAAGLASSPGALGPALDRVRAVTARLRSNEPFTPEDEHALVEAYREIEAYLVNTEPIRRYDRTELQSLIQRRFQGQVEAPEFWQQVAPNQPAPV
jgi:hypothetical protein